MSAQITIEEYIQVKTFISKSITKTQIELGCFENRKSLPKEWAGLRDEKLQEVSKIKTAKFCHNACFICTAETREDAIKMAEIAQKA